MKNRGIIGVSVFAAAAFSANAAQASDGTITFNGKVIAQTCTINGGGAGNNFTVTLPTVSSSDLATAGSTTGRTAFSIALTNCTPATGNVSAFFEQGSTVDSVTNNLINQTGGGTTAEIQLVNANGSTIAIGHQPTPDTTNAVALNAGAATLNYAAQYYAKVANTTAGALTTTVTYSINYN